MPAQSSSNGGLGFGSILTLIFITLKLTNVIDWSWWWVLAPMWGPFALVVVIALVAGVCVAVKGDN